MKKNLLFLFLFIMGIAITNQLNATVRYVKSTAAGTGDGSSWADASGDLQAMINASATNDEVWVAAGTYKPKYRADNMSGANPADRQNAFVLKADVKIYGGFAGTETALTERNWNTNRTILSGDFNGNDGISGYVNNFEISGNTENAYHVVISSGNVGAATLDGFTITGGNANAYNAGITVNGNFLQYPDAGGGIYAIYSAPLITNCIITRNSVESTGGAGIASFSSDITVVNSIISQNIGIDGAYGAGVYAKGGSTQYINVTIANNRTGGGGGGGAAFFSATPKIYNSLMLENIGGAGSGIYNQGSTLDVRNSLVFAYSGGVNNLNGYSVFASDVFINVSDPSSADYLRIKATSPTINAGSNTLYTGGQKDLEGNPRIQGVYIDLGAYEWQCITPAAPTANTAQTFSAGATVADLTATPEGNNALKWYAAQTGGEPLAGSTPLENGATYYVSQTGANGCESARKAVTVTVSSSTDITDTQGTMLKVYPNPVTNGGAFTVETDRAETAVLYDVNGKTIKTIVLAEGKNEVNTGKLPAGMYLLRTASGKQVKLAVK